MPKARCKTHPRKVVPPIGILEYLPGDEPKRPPVMFLTIVIRIITKDVGVRMHAVEVDHTIRFAGASVANLTKGAVAL